MHVTSKKALCFPRVLDQAEICCHVVAAQIAPGLPAGKQVLNCRHTKRGFQHLEFRGANLEDIGFLLHYTKKLRFAYYC